MPNIDWFSKMGTNTYRYKRLAFVYALAYGLTHQEGHDRIANDYVIERDDNTRPFKRNPYLAHFVHMAFKNRKALLTQFNA